MTALSVPTPSCLVSSSGSGDDNDSDDERASQDSFSDAMQSLDTGNSMKPPPIIQLPQTTSTTIDSTVEQEEDDDAPPAFPALNSAQRAGGGGGGAAAAVGSSSRPTPPASSSSKASTLRNILGVPSRPAQQSSSGLMVPPSTSALTAPPGVGGASGARSAISTAGGLGVPGGSASSKRKKVILEPGCSPLDWARLKSSTDLRGGITSLQRIPPSELALHKTEGDAWSAFNGKVYNLTPYLRFHPGGVKELMRVAGRDGTRLFMLTHSWVNIDAMIDSAMVGMLVPEPTDR